MILERREFLKLLGGAAGAAALGGCGRFLVPDRLVEAALRGPGIESHHHTLCGLCEGGCGLTVRLVDGLPVGLKGNPRHPLNRGGLCPVGQAGLEVLYAPDRLQGPRRRRADGDFEAVGWEEALGEIADRVASLVAGGQGRRVALLSGEPGRLFDELATRFVHALGSPNVARPEEAAALPYLLSQGLDRVPGFDLAHSDLVLSVGLDLFEDGAAPIHVVSAMVGWRARAERGRLIHVGSRLSPTATKADEHLAVRPGTHAAVALGIAHVLVREGRYDRRFVSEHTFGFEDWTDDAGRPRLGFRRLLLERYYPDRAAQLSGCDAGQIIRAARRLARAASPVVVWGGEAATGPNAASTGLAVHALNALLGAFDRPGGVVLPPPIPFTPLAPLPEPAGPGIFAPNGAGAAPGSDPIAALAAARDLEVVFLVGANPVHDSPAGDELAAALRGVPLVVACSPFLDETAACADLVLPTPLFFETWQESTTPPGVAFSVLGVTRPVVEPLFDSRHPGDVLLELARRAGGPAAAALPWKDYRGYLEQRLEGLLVSGQGSVISGSFEETWVHFLEERGWRFLERGDRDAFWSDLTTEGGWWNPVRAGGDWERLFPTRSGRFEFFSLELERRLGERAGADAAATPAGDEAFLPHFEPPPATAPGELTLVPFRPITGRGTLGVSSPMVLEMYGHVVLSGWQTWAELAPETAHELGLHEGDRVELESTRGRLEAVVSIEPGATPGAVHVPLGLGRRQPGGAADGVGANPVALAAAGSDPISGRLATGGTPVRVRLVERRRRGGPRPLAGGHG